MRNEKLILSLDNPDCQKTIRLLDEIGGKVWWVKIGFQYLTMFQSNWLNYGLRYKLFLDLKFHDTPDAVARNIKMVTEFGISMTNMHISGGMEMMKRAIESATKAARPLPIEKPILLGVTVLTTMTEYQFYQSVTSERKVVDEVVRLAKNAKAIGLDGVIASPLEIEAIRNECGEDFIIVCPGIRPKWSRPNDQKRYTTPKRAIELGADYIVVGRPIMESKDPVGATLKILEDIEGV